MKLDFPKKGKMILLKYKNQTLHIHTCTQKRGAGEVTLGLSAGGPFSSTEAASSGFKSKPKERGGWALCFGASVSTDHCDETKFKIVNMIYESVFFYSLLRKTISNCCGVVAALMLVQSGVER